MKRFSIVLIAFIVFTSCNNNGGEQGAATQDTLTVVPDQQTTQNLSGCYLRVLKRDTLALSLQENGDTLTGRLIFDNYEKDGSTGTVNGFKHNGIVKLIYNFRSEGMYSIMEVYLKITDGGLIHGIGEVATKTDTTYFVNPENISYPADNELRKIPCERLDPKFR